MAANRENRQRLENSLSLVIRRVRSLVAIKFSNGTWFGFLYLSVLQDCSVNIDNCYENKGGVQPPKCP